ncbi:RecX family transcriptional regulator [Vibrio parahaemolyticus]|uniref:RecX family transcriptional regulator n=1 Tax=Vibrio parahaemolyticus TaxID=670 RepID=UPI0015D17342|nr:RecX family transcriptional regulator [Vibrio parahaemolyticus]NYU23880.1 hypothetical protein [Vibrio parahaemolyticus]
MYNDELNTDVQTKTVTKKQLKQASCIDDVSSYARFWLEYKNYFLTIPEMKERLARKTNNTTWIDQVVNRLVEVGSLKLDSAFVESYAQQCFFGDYGSGYIVNKLTKKGLSKEFVLSHISKYKLAHNIDEQKILNGYINSTYISFTITIESLRRNLEKRGFHWKAVDQAIKQHPKSNTLKTKIQVKAEKTDVKAEIVKMSRRGKGLRFITQVLKSKLVDVSNIEKLANELALDGDVDFYQIATSELSKYASKRRLNLKEYSDKSKAFKYLLERGFTTDQINYGLDELLKTE